MVALISHFLSESYGRDQMLVFPPTVPIWCWGENDLILFNYFSYLALKFLTLLPKI